MREDLAIEAIENMTIKEFSKAQVGVRVHSDALEEHFWIVSDPVVYDVIRKQHPDEVIYTPKELLKIVRVLRTGDYDMLRTIHLTKKIYNGRLRKLTRREKEEKTGDLFRSTREKIRNKTKGELNPV